MHPIIAYGDAIAEGIAKANPPTVNLGKAGAGLAANTLPSTHGIASGAHIIVALGWSDLNAVFGAQPYLSAVHYEQRVNMRLGELASRTGGAPMVMIGLEPLAKRYPGLHNDAVEAMNRLLMGVAHRHHLGFLVPQTHPSQHRARDGLHYTQAGYELLFRHAGRIANTHAMRHFKPGEALTAEATRALLSTTVMPIRDPFA
jgi:hypothetical protein